jgi:hypothetical protein
MKILCLHNSYHAPTIKAHEIDPLRRHRRQVLYQGTPAVQTMTAGAGQ